MSTARSPRCGGSDQLLVELDSTVQLTVEVAVQPDDLSCPPNEPRAEVPSRRSATTAEASAAESPGGTSSAVSSARRISGSMPGASVATIAAPAAIASSTETAVPSRDGTDSIDVGGGMKREQLLGLEFPEGADGVAEIELVDHRKQRRR